MIFFEVGVTRVSLKSRDCLGNAIKGRFAVALGFLQIGQIFALRAFVFWAVRSHGLVASVESTIQAGLVASSYALLGLRKRDIASRGHGFDFGEGYAPKNERVADFANTFQVARNNRYWEVVQHPPGRAARRAALQAIELTGFAFLLFRGPPLVKERTQFSPKNEHWTPVFDAGQTGLDPRLYRAFVNVQALGDFANRIGAMDFNAPTVDFAIGHGSLHACLNQAANVFNAPCRYARSKLHWLWETARLDAFPPRRFADGDGTARGED